MEGNYPERFLRKRYCCVFNFLLQPKVPRVNPSCQLSASAVLNFLMCAQLTCTSIQDYLQMKPHATSVLYCDSLNNAFHASDHASRGIIPSRCSSLQPRYVSVVCSYLSVADCILKIDSAVSVSVDVLPCRFVVSDCVSSAYGSNPAA